MLQLLLFALFTALMLGVINGVGRLKKIAFRSTFSLFVFGILMSIPFLMVEYMANHLKYYLVILAFVGIEVGLLFLESKVKYLHQLLHHHIKQLRIISFILIGLGFTYSEISFTIFKTHGSLTVMLNILPFKTTYSLLIHTVLASAASLVRLGNLFAETIYETVFKLLSYYSRIVVISVSHYVYVFSVKNNFLLLMMGVLTLSTICFFYLKKHLDLKHA